MIPLIAIGLLLVLMILGVQLVLATLAAYAFARFEFRGKDIAFALVLVVMALPWSFQNKCCECCQCLGCCLCFGC